MVQLPPRLNTRLWSTAIVVGIAFGLAGLVLYRVSTTTVRPLHETFASMTAKVDGQLHGFQGRDQDKAEQDPETVILTDSLDHVNRTYLNPETGQGIAMHIAAWDALDKPTLPHPPSICYVASGYSIADSQPIEISDGEDKVNARVLTMKRDGIELYVLYWYRWDRFVCTTRWEAVLARLKLIGQPEWPPVIKVMIETPVGPIPSDSLKALVTFAGDVNKSTKQM
jgi:hypothetical protein